MLLSIWNKGYIVFLWRKGRVHIFLCASVDSIDNVVPVWAGLPEQDSSCAHMQGTCATPMIKALQIAMVLGLGRFRIDRDMLMYFKLRNYKVVQGPKRP
jgi:hypothetical protein